MKTTARFDSLPVYLLATIPQKKRDLIARGVDVIDLGAGDADLAAPPKAVEALITAVQDPAMSRYGFGLGYPKFREAVSAWMEKRFGHRFDPLKEVVPLIGSKEGIAHFCFATLQKGDVAIILVRFLVAASTAGGKEITRRQLLSVANDHDLRCAIERRDRLLDWDLAGLVEDNHVESRALER